MKNENEIQELLKKIVDEVGPIEYVDSEKINDHDFEHHFIPMVCCISTQHLIDLCVVAGLPSPTLMEQQPTIKRTKIKRKVLKPIRKTIRRGRK